MGKRSSFERIERDLYPTPKEAVEPLLKRLPAWSTFAEPCCGDGALARHLQAAGHELRFASDIEPLVPYGVPMDYTNLHAADVEDSDFIITNPPWDRKILHPMICHFMSLKPTWLLFDADWLHTKQSAPFMSSLVEIVSVGRVKWFPDSKMTGKDNCAWYLFDAAHTGTTRFIGR